MKLLKKWWKTIVLVLTVGLILLFVAITLMLGTMVKYGILNVLPEITGTAVKLESLNFSLLKGRITIKNFIIENPQGFCSPHAFKLAELKIDLDPMSLMSEKIIIEEILIDGAHVIYEPGLGTSNLTEIQSNIREYSASEKNEEEKTGVEEKENIPSNGKHKKFQIDVFDFSNGKISVSGGKIVEGRGVLLSLPDIRLEGIGRDSEEGVTSAVVAEKIYEELYKNALKLVDSPGSIIKEGASKMLDKLKNIFK